jgi:ABC-2 type transport system permease protein
MNAAVNDQPPARPAEPTAVARARTFARNFYWQVRRELWEHRAIYLAPAIIAGIALIGVIIGAANIPSHFRNANTAMYVVRQGALAVPYIFVAVAVIVTSSVVVVFYCLGALHNERRDRTILFWKSLPVSDATTVLAKAAIPLVVTPVVLFAVIFVTHLLMLPITALVAYANGFDFAFVWQHAHIADMWRMLAEGLPYLALWYAPLYAWLFLVSAWARHAPYLWAIVPPVALALLERLSLGTHYVWSWLRERIFGAFAGATGENHLSDNLDPGGWGSIHLWTGIVAAVLLLALTIYVRRTREPM